MPDRTAIEKMTRARMPNSTDGDVQAAVKAAYDAAIVKRDNDLFQTGRLYAQFFNSY